MDPSDQQAKSKIIPIASMLVLGALFTSAQSAVKSADNSAISMQIGAVLILLALSAFFSSAETALMGVNKIRIKTLADNGDARAKVLLRLLKDSNKFLSTILVGNNIINLSVSALVTTLTINLFGVESVGIATAILTVLILVFGEIMPKTIANVHSESIALTYAKPIWLIIQMMGPLVFIINFITMLFLKVFKINMESNSITVTESEVKTIINVGHEEGTIESQEKDIIDNVFDLKAAYAKDVMVPKISMISIDINSSYDEVLDVFKSEQYTRYPIFEDESDNIVGVINIKDLLIYNLSDKDNFDLRNILRQPYFTYEFKKTSELMLEMREDKKHLKVSMAIVLDEYGVAVGMITLEDLLEELVGEIRDEYDEHEENLIQQIADNEYMIEGSLKLDDINNQLDLYNRDLALESKEYDSIGGLLIELLERIPEQGEFVVNDCFIKIIAFQVDGNRIEKVKLDLTNAKSNKYDDEDE